MRSPFCGPKDGLGRAAAEEGAWAEAEKAFRDAISFSFGPDGSEGGVSGSGSSILTAQLTAAARRAEGQAWLAWVCAHSGKAAEAVTLATAARDFQQAQLAKVGDRDMTRLAATFAEIALARV